MRGQVLHGDAWCTTLYTGIINTTKIVLSAPLPRVYQDAGNGKAQPVVPGNRPPGLIGGEFNAEELGRVSKETVRDVVPCTCCHLVLRVRSWTRRCLPP